MLCTLANEAHQIARAAATLRDAIGLAYAAEEDVTNEEIDAFYEQQAELASRLRVLGQLSEVLRLANDSLS